VSIEQDSLIFIGRIDFAPRDGEIDHLTIYQSGSRNLTEQLALRKNAKAPRTDA
jgi:hypothetical protein